MRRKLLALFAVLAFTVPLHAQDATPEPTPEPPPVEVVVDAPNAPVVVNEDAPDPLAPLLAMAASVFAIMELLKNAILADLVKGLEERQKAAVNWLVATVLALLLMLGAAPGSDIFSITGYPAQFPDFVARLITAFIIGGGNGIIHAIYEFLRTPRTVATARLAVVDPRAGVDTHSVR